MMASTPSLGTFCHTREIDVTKLFTLGGSTDTDHPQEIHFQSLPLTRVRNVCVCVCASCELLYAYCPAQSEFY